MKKIWVFKAIFFVFVAGSLMSPLFGEEAVKQELKEEISETAHSIKIRGKDVLYKATAGTLLLKDKQDKTKASVSYVAYIKDDENIAKRPITFCFNGGPGSCAVWLHLGTFGPRIISLNDDGCAPLQSQLEDNGVSILDVTDLVFIDPVSTGYSRPAQGEDPKQFHGVTEDIQWVAEFIRLYTTRGQRWGSPKFLAGESYGTMRAAGVASYLHETYHMHCNGVILVSSVLNYQTLIDPQRGNDLPYLLSLPSYTATAWYHHRLPEELLNRDLPSVLKEVQDFTDNEYSVALLKGDALGIEDQKNIAEKLARYTGLKPLYVERANLRIDMGHFTKELLRDDKRTCGRFDSRLKGIDYDVHGTSFEYDPSLDAIAGGFTAAFNHYLRSELKWARDDNYQIFGDVHPWNYGKMASNQYLSLTDTLREIMTRNPYFLVFVASGYYDLATPYFATDYTFNHLGLDPSLKKNVRLEYYEGGHMMYTNRSALTKLCNDVSSFIKSSCADSKGKNDG